MELPSYFKGEEGRDSKEGKMGSLGLPMDSTGGKWDLGIPRDSKKKDP